QFPGQMSLPYPAFTIDIPIKTSSCNLSLLTPNRTPHGKTNSYNFNTFIEPNMDQNSTFCQRAPHPLHLLTPVAWWDHRDRAPEGTCPLQFSRRVRQRIIRSRFVCGIGSTADVLTGK